MPWYQKAEDIGISLVLLWNISDMFQCFLHYPVTTAWKETVENAGVPLLSRGRHYFGRRPQSEAVEVCVLEWVVSVGENLHLKNRGEKGKNTQTETKKIEAAEILTLYLRRDKVRLGISKWEPITDKPKSIILIYSFYTNNDGNPFLCVFASIISLVYSIWLHLIQPSLVQLYWWQTSTRSQPTDIELLTLQFLAPLFQPLGW